LTEAVGDNVGPIERKVSISLETNASGGTQTGFEF
jgi:hypothetical protein